MRAYYEAKHHPKGNSCTKEAYSVWRNENENTRPSIDANKLANVRGDILKNKRLSENQLNVIEQEILLSSEKIIAQSLESTNRNADIVEINDIEETNEYSAKVHLGETQKALLMISLKITRSLHQKILKL